MDIHVELSMGHGRFDLGWLNFRLYNFFTAVILGRPAFPSFFTMIDIASNFAFAVSVTRFHLTVMY